MKTYDIAIVGGGFIGLTLAHALQKSNLNIALVDISRLDVLKIDDERSITLAPSSKLLFEAIGIWTYLVPHITPIKKIHISNQGRMVSTRLSAEDFQKEALGYVIKASVLQRHLYQSLIQNERVKVYAPAQVSSLTSSHTGGREIEFSENCYENISAKLVIGADGANSMIRKSLGIDIKVTEYPPALIANLNLKRDHHNIAYERFQQDGPMALLPKGPKKMGLVWCIEPQFAKTLMAHSQSLIEKIQQEFGYRVGRINAIEQIKQYPLKTHFAKTMVKSNTIIIGNAFHTLHPIAGQGLNLGLRDVTVLSAMLMAHQDNIHGLDLQAFAKVRMRDHMTTDVFTRGLLTLFYRQHPSAVLFRLMAMSMIDKVDVCKRMLGKIAMGQSKFLQTYLDTIQTHKMVQHA